MIEGSNIKPIVRALKSIQCAKIKRQSITRLYFGNNIYQVKAGDLATAIGSFKPDCSEEKIKFVLTSEGETFTNDYYETDFMVNDIIFNDEARKVQVKGEEFSLFVSCLDNFADEAPRLYEFIKSLFTVSMADVTLTDAAANRLTLEDLQFESRCVYEALSVSRRTELIQEIIEGAIVTSKEKIVTNILNTVTSQSDAKALINFFKNTRGVLAELDKDIATDNKPDYYFSLMKIYFLAEGNTSLEDKAELLESLTKDSHETEPDLGTWAKKNVLFWHSPSFIDVVTFKNKMGARILYEDFTIEDDASININLTQEILSVEGEYSINLNPFDLVRVDILSDSKVFNTTKGNSIYIPSFAISLLILEQEAQLKQEKRTAFNALLTIVGVRLAVPTRWKVFTVSTARAVPYEVQLMLSYLRVTPKSFATLFLTDVGLQVTTNYLIDQNWANALGQVDLFDAAFNGTVGNIARVPIKGNQLLHLAKYGKQFSLCRQITSNTTKVVTIEFTKIAFDYKLAENDFKTLCDNNEEYYDVLAKLILSLAAHYTAEEIHGFLKGWNSNVVKNIEVEFDQISRPILLKLNEIVQTDNFGQIISTGTGVIAKFIEQITLETAEVEYKVIEIQDFEKPIIEFKSVLQDNTNVVLPLIE